MGRIHSNFLFSNLFEWNKTFDRFYQINGYFRIKETDKIYCYLPAISKSTFPAGDDVDLFESALICLCPVDPFSG